MAHVADFTGPNEYDVERLRELAGVDEDTIPEFPSHECQHCGYCVDVDDHKKHAPNYCDECETIRTFIKL